ncbi:MAG TPA: UvrD-helicase domain-containing protein, partial [Anaerolineae bacterium]|nr:UvrD-helicase domain-containing protein [Anaerolineae bacterium]
MAAEDRIIGPPGTGKTTALARALKWNADQVGPDLVIAISHTRAAAAELAGRDTTLPSGNVGTLHSFAFSALNHPAIIEGDRKALLAFNREHAAYQFASCRPVEDLEAGVAVQDRGEAMLAEYGRLRNMMLPRDQWPNMEVLAFAEVWESFK